jgi:hypothetical protein
MIAVSGAFAEDFKTGSDVSISGFGTLGLTHNSTDKAEFIRDILQPRGVGDGWSGDVDTRIGVQLDMRASDEIEGVVQAVSYYNHEGSYFPELTWAFIGYSPAPSFRARAGRLGWDVYMLSDSRNVGYSYLWVRPPVDYFGPLQISHIDGADGVLKHEQGGALWSLKLYGGRADQEIPSPPGEDYDLSGSRVLGVNLDYQKDAWHFRAGYTSVKIRNELAAFVPLFAGLRATGIPEAGAIASDMSLAGKTLEFVTAGAVYESGAWQSQLMFNRLNSDTLAYPQKDSAYFLLGYRTGQWTPFLTLSGTRSKGTQRATGLPTPNPLDAAVSASLAAAQSRQHTLSVGVRYDFMRNADLKVQLDRVRVSDNAALLWRNAKPDWNGRATVFGVTLDFVF